MRRVLLIDNYDSFTFNLVQAFAVTGADVIVRRNDECSPDDLTALEPTHVVLSPGPGRPERAGATPVILAAAVGVVPVLGVCLGHQAIARHFGGSVVHGTAPVHGKASRVYHDGGGVLTGLPMPFDAGRYHSLVVAEDGLPSELRISAWTSDGEIMGLRHRTLAVEGVQFHPESVLTAAGERLLRNFLNRDTARRVA